MLEKFLNKFYSSPEAKSPVMVETLVEEPIAPAGYAEATQEAPHPSGYPATVVEIHNSFNTAGDRILEKANAILKEASLKSLEKGKKLQELGFVNCREARECSETQQKQKDAEEVLKLLAYYKQHYPTYKFIRERQVLTICEKWNLILAPAERFIGFVPASNLKDIENFSLREEDIIYMRTRTNHRGMQSFVGPPISKEEYLAVLASGPIHEDGVEIANKGFMICAPPKDINTYGMSVKNKKLVVSHPDPIVLKEVVGGYLIITAWGNEASDPEVIDERKN